MVLNGVIMLHHTERKSRGFRVIITILLKSQYLPFLAVFLLKGLNPMLLEIATSC